MIKISRKNLTLVSQFIMSNFKGEKQQLDNYLIDSAGEIIKNCDIGLEEDDFIEAVSDIESTNFTCLIKAIESLISKYGASARISLVYSPPVYLISNTRFGVNAIKGNSIRFIKMINYILENDKNNGSF